MSIHADPDAALLAAARSFEAQALYWLLDGHPEPARAGVWRQAARALRRRALVEPIDDYVYDPIYQKCIRYLRGVAA